MQGRVTRVLHKVNFHVDIEPERAGSNTMAAFLTIHRKDGQVVTGRADFPKRGPFHFMPLA